MNKDRNAFILDSFEYLQMPTTITSNPIFKKMGIAKTLSGLVDVLFKTLALNQTKARSKLKYVLSDWNLFCGQMAEMEKSFPTKTKYLSIYFLLVINRLLIHHYQLGFALDLYESYELDDIFSVLSFLFENSYKFETHIEQNLRKKKKGSKIKPEDIKFRISHLKMSHLYCSVASLHFRALTKEYSLPVFKEFPQISRESLLIKRFYIMLNLVNIPQPKFSDFDEQRKESYKSSALSLYEALFEQYKSLKDSITVCSKSCPESKKDDYSLYFQSLLKNCVTNSINVQKKIMEKSQPTNDPSRISINASFSLCNCYPLFSVNTW